MLFGWSCCPELKSRTTQAIREMVGRDELRVGNRGSHRYSFGSAPASFGFQDYWSVLIDPPVLMEVMEAIFGTKEFVTNSGSGGGDYNVPGSVEYQNLHSDRCVVPDCNSGHQLVLVGWSCCP